MELRQLLYFEAVARLGGFTRAAEALHVAQPSVSAQVRQLEKRLGVDLLVRTTRRVTLTPAGEQLLRRVHRITDELEAAQHEMSAHATALAGRVRLGATPILGDLPLPGLLGRFTASHPGVEVELSSGLIGELLDQLAAGDLDLVIGPDHGPDPRFRSRILAEERFVLITAPGDTRSIGDLRQVAHEPFVCLPQDSGMHRLLTEAAGRAGFAPRITVRTHSPHSIRELVSAGTGVAMVTESSVTGPGRPVRIHRLRDAPDHPAISVFRPRGRVNRAAQAMVELLARAATVTSAGRGQGPDAG